MRYSSSRVLVVVWNDQLGSPKNRGFRKIMMKSLYIASLEPNSGKLVVTLGVMEMLSRQVNRLGFFRSLSPVAAEEDSHIQLLANRFKLSLTPAQMVGVTHDQARTWLASGEERRLFREIVSRFKQAEALCDFLLVEGPDITHLSDAFNYDVSIRIARELGTPALYVSSGLNTSTSDLTENIRIAEQTFKQLKCPLLGIIVNRVDPENIDAIRTELEEQCAAGLSINFLPEEKYFSNPTMEEVVVALDAEWFSGPKAGLHRNPALFKAVVFKGVSPAKRVSVPCDFALRLSAISRR